MTRLAKAPWPCEPMTSKSYFPWLGQLGNRRRSGAHFGNTFCADAMAQRKLVGCRDDLFRLLSVVAVHHRLPQGRACPCGQGRLYVEQGVLVVFAKQAVVAAKVDQQALAELAAVNGQKYFHGVPCRVGCSYRAALLAARQLMIRPAQRLTGRSSGWARTQPVRSGRSPEDCATIRQPDCT